MDDPNYFDNVPPEDEVDARNDETFGGDVADLNDDWEDEHEKVAGLLDARQKMSNLSFLKAGLSPIAHSNQRDEFFEDDFLEKNLKTLILDEDESFFMSKAESANGTPKKTSKVQLNALKPPSPFILPYDDPLMSSVWKFEGDGKEQSSSSGSSAPASPKELDQLSGNGVSQLSNKGIRLEDLEAQILGAEPPKPSDVPKPAPWAQDAFNAGPPPPTFPFSHLPPGMLPQPPSSMMPGMPPSMHPQQLAMLHQFLMAQMAAGQQPSAELLKYLSSLGKPPGVSSAPNSNFALPMMPKMAPPGLGPANSSPQKSSVTGSPQHAASPMTSTSSAETKASPAAYSKSLAEILQQRQQIHQQQQQTHKMPLPAQEFLAANQTMMMNKMAMFANGFPPLLAGMQPPTGTAATQMASAMAAASNMIKMPAFLNPLVQEQQRMIINKIITPAQAQRSYANARNFDRRNIDHYAGFMTQREKEWLIKIFRLQTKVNDPYVEDYYEVSFNLKKSMIKKLASLYKEKQEHTNDVDIDNFIAAESLVVLPELAKGEDDKPKYIQFDNALGKIQVSNSRCPRKAVEIETSLNAQMTTYKLCAYSQMLLKIERLYDNLLDIEDEDKRMPILPKQNISEHMIKRRLLCTKLFQGLVCPAKTDKNVVGTKFELLGRVMPTLKRLDLQLNSHLLSINKGLLLVYRSLFQLQEESHLVVIVGSLLKSHNFLSFVLKAEERTKAAYGNTLIKAIKRMTKTHSIMYIAACIDDADVFVNNKYGLGLLDALFQQYIKSDECQLYLYFWKMFVMQLSKEASLSDIASNYYQLICAI